MAERGMIAMFFFPQALDVLGEAIRPYLLDGPAGPHLLCRVVDTGGAFVEATLDGRDAQDRPVQLDLMIPAQFIRLMISVHSNGEFGFAVNAGS